MIAAEAGARHIIDQCGGLAAGERVLVVGSEDAPEVARLLAEAAREITPQVELRIIPPAPMHGAEPPPEVAQAMLGAALIVGATSKSMAHTQARLRACGAGARYLSLPDFSIGLLGSKAVLADYRGLQDAVRRVADRLSSGRRIEVTTAKGTALSLDTGGRPANCCPGFVEGPGQLGSPPDIEANISPLEGASQGVIVVDGSIAHPDFGVLRSPVTLHVEGGMIRAWEGEPEIIAGLERLFAGYPDNARVLAECGIGMNPLAELTGSMLTDEGCAGAVHFGFGSNATVGGVNAVDFHLDFCMRDATLKVDGETMIEAGMFAPWTGFKPS